MPKLSTDLASRCILATILASTSITSSSKVSYAVINGVELYLIGCWRKVRGHDFFGTSKEFHQIIMRVDLSNQI